jgi:SAM-dependent methyltransferase
MLAMSEVVAPGPRAAIPDGVQAWRPNVARMLDYYMGGKDNFAADREAARYVLAAAPDMPFAVRENRGFLVRAIRFLADHVGIAQFIDIGPRLPTGTNVHHIAHRFRPGARVAYVDNDPMVLSHGRARLARHPSVTLIEGDLREPGKILADPQLRALIDLGQPAGLCLTLVLQHLRDADHPRALVAELVDGLAPGSYLVLSHVTGDGKSARLRNRIASIYDQASAPLVMRSRDEVSSFLTGCALVPPGLVYVAQWQRQEGTTVLRSGGTRWMHGGVGMKRRRPPR